ncbi:hypothetical protein BKG92_10440 [Rodentibacter ratti]|uniref:OmpA-like domain-containing protein n=1 Tax=Rodentibacter ratti TaxID=1906745 RepID=A0A1V3KS37_9PAST|nr:OmpA family protein [Rodentibacter ratti]OOF80496.1 hypothetical protein BKG92_10440 [Rodentibacter ratti]
MKKTLVYLGLTLSLVACSTHKDSSQPIEIWKNFEQSTVNTQTIGKGQSLVVVYRQNDIQGPAVNVYINGDYQASLLPNAYSPVAVCAAKNLFTSSFSSNTAFGNRTQGVHYTLPVNEITYVKVSQAPNGKLNFIRVDKSTAEQDIAQLPKENQTLSRVKAPQNCDALVLANAELDASALFAFNKSSYKDVLPEGKQSIANFAAQLGALTGLSKLVVSGHTDPTGSAAYNQKLSQKRADSVKVALQKAGVTLPIEAVGYGKSQPVVTHCSSLKGKEKQLCNQPNRRVEITAYDNK